MSTYELRVFTIDDYPVVRTLWESSDGVGLSDADSLDGVRKVLARNPGMSFVALSESKIVGAILVGHDGRRGLIHHLAVERTLQRSGVGRALVHRAIEGLRKVGIAKTHLLVFAANENARAFWRRIRATERVDLVLFSMNTD
jgi:ribosomal protein S18 acetylase RimI-like enzyme